MLRQQEKHMKKRGAEHLMGPVATIFAASNTGSWRLERPAVDYAACIKCGTCEKYCPSDVITVVKDDDECVKINFDYCKGCGICANECPKQCISMIEEGGEGNV